MYFLYLIAATQPQSQTIKAPAWFSSTKEVFSDSLGRMTSIPGLQDIPDKASLDSGLRFLESLKTLSDEPEDKALNDRKMAIDVLEKILKAQKIYSNIRSAKKKAEKTASKKEPKYDLFYKEMNEFLRDAWGENSRLEKALKHAFRQDIPEEKAESFDQGMCDTLSKEIDAAFNLTDCHEIGLKMASVLGRFDEIQNKSKELELVKEILKKLQDKKKGCAGAITMDLSISEIQKKQFLLEIQINKQKEEPIINKRYQDVRAALLSADPNFFKDEGALKQLSPVPVTASPASTVPLSNPVEPPVPQVKEPAKSEPKSFQERLQDIQTRLDEIGKKLKEIEAELNLIADKLKEIEGKLVQLQQALLEQGTSAQDPKSKPEIIELKQEFPLDNKTEPYVYFEDIRVPDWFIRAFNAFAAKQYDLKRGIFEGSLDPAEPVLNKDSTAINAHIEDIKKFYNADQGAQNIKDKLKKIHDIFRMFYLYTENEKARLMLPPMSFALSYPPKEHWVPVEDFFKDAFADNKLQEAIKQVFSQDILTEQDQPLTGDLSKGIDTVFATKFEPELDTVKVQERNLKKFGAWKDLIIKIGKQTDDQLPLLSKASAKIQEDPDLDIGFKDNLLMTIKDQLRDNPQALRALETKKDNELYAAVREALLTK